METKQKPRQVYQGPASNKEYKEILSVLKKSFKKMGWANLEEKKLIRSLKAIRPKLNHFTWRNFIEIHFINLATEPRNSFAEI